LLGADTELLDEPNPQALDNVNTPEEYRSAMTSFPPPPAAAQPKHVNVQYYALLREQAGRRDERLVTSAQTAEELYAELSRRYPFTLASRLLRVAINTEFREWSAPLAEGDTIVFIPPVAGG